MQLIYSPEINGSDYVLEKNESRHLIKVLRKKKGDQLYLTDGKGNFYLAEIQDDHADKCRLTIVDSHKEPKKRNYSLHIAIAPTKNINRFEWFLEKSTEIGIDVITPVICEHSERKKLRYDRLEKVIVSAMCQSLQAYKPKLNALINFEEFIRASFTSGKYIAHCSDNYSKEPFRKVSKFNESILMLIGPEGGFSQLELELAISQQFYPVSLGNQRLRTETAGIVAACKCTDI